MRISTALGLLAASVLGSGLAQAETKTWAPSGSPLTKTAERLSWHNPANWQPYGVPTKSDDVIIRNYIFLNGKAECKSLMLSSFTLHLQGNILTVENKADIRDFALVDPQGPGKLVVKGKMDLDGTLWISQNRNFYDNYVVTGSAIAVKALGNVVAPDDREYAGVPGIAPLKTWDKVKSSGSKMLAAKVWDAGAGDGLWSSANNWDNVAAPTNNDNITIGVDATVTCDVSVNGLASLTGGDNIIAGVNGADVTLQINDGITVRFRAASAVNAFGADNSGIATTGTVVFTQSSGATNKTGKFRFVSTNSDFVFNNTAFEIYGTQFSDNYEFGTSGSIFTFLTGNSVRYLRSGDQTIATTLPTPNLDAYQTLQIGGTGVKTLAGNVSASTVTFNNTAFTLDPQSSTNKLTVTGGSAPTTQANNTYIVRGSTFTDNYSGFSTSAINGTVQFNSSSSQSVPGYNFSTLQLYGSGTKTLSANLGGADGLTLTIGDGATGSTLNLNSYNLGTGTVDVTVAANSTLQIPNTAATNISTITANTNSSVNYTSSSDQTVSSGTYYNLNLTGNGSIKTLGGNITINGGLVVGDGTNPTTLNLNGNGITGSATVASNSTLQIPNTTGTPVSGTITANTNSTVSYNGNGAQTITSGTYYNLQTSNSGTKTLGGNAVVTGSASVGAGTTLDLDTRTLTGNVSIANTGTLAFSQTTSTVTGTLTPASGSSVTYSANGNQNVINSSYHNLTISGTGTKTLTGNTTVNGTATVSGTLDLSSYTLNGTTSVSGTLSFSSTSSDVVGTLTATGGTLNYSANGNQTVKAVNSAAVNTSGSGTKSLAGNATVTTTTVGSGTTYDVGSNTLTGNVTVSAGGTLTLSSTSSSVTGTISANNTNATVQYSAGGSQAVSAGTYNNLTLSGSGTKTFAGNATVNGLLSLASGVTANTSTYTVALGTTGSISESGTFTGFISATDADGDGSYGNIGITIANSSGALGSNITATRATGSGNVSQHTSYGGNILRRFTLTGGTLGSSVITNSNSGTITLGYSSSELNGQTQSTLRAYRLSSAGLAYPLKTESSDGKFGEPMDGNTSKSFQLYRFFTSQAPNQGVIFDFGNGSGSDAALPVELASFAAASLPNGIELSWRTASESNNAGFVLSRRESSGAHFEEISSYLSNNKLVGAGNSSVGRSYAHLDNGYLTAGKSYQYQLEDVSFDGKRTIIGNVTINYAPAEVLSSSSYPNPVRNTANFEVISPAKGIATLEILDLEGKSVMVKEGISVSTGKNIVELSFDSVANGTYTYRITMAGSEKAAASYGTLTVVR